jgi:peptide/nickel transport system substrate-binding protein
MKALRTFHGQWGVQLLATLALGLLVAGTRTALAGTPRAASTPKSGGNITIRLQGAPECLDPAKQDLTYDDNINYPVIDTLLSLNEKGKPVPYLAQKYTVSKNGKTITFYLRHDVKYSDGRPMVASDVKADFEYVLNPATKSPISKGFLGPVTSIDTSGKYIVRLHLSAPNRVLLANLGLNYLGIFDPKSLTAAGGNSCNGLVGSGPFKISSVGPAYSTVQETRNARHTFGPSWAHNKGPAYLSSLTFVPITSDTTAVSELLSGQIDISNVPGTELPRVQSNKSIKLYRTLSQGEGFLEFNSGRAPFDNVAVRRAVAEAIDRKAVITAAFQGLAKVSTSILPPNVFAYDPGSVKYAPKLNLNAARAAISAAHATGPYTLLTYNLPQVAAAAELIQGELAQVGMQVNLVNKPVGDWLAQLRQENFDLAMITYTHNDPDVLYQLFHSSQRNGGINFTNMTDQALDQQLMGGRTTLNLKKARADYYQAQKLIDTKVYGDPLWVPITIDAVRSRVQGWHVTQSGQIQWQDLWIK